MEEANRKAASVVFNANNKDLDENTIDLHGLHVTEAIQRVEQRVKQAREEGRKNLTVIVGRGNHSVDGIPKLKPAVERLMAEQAIFCTPDKPRLGCIYCEIGPVGSKGGWLSKVFGDCLIM